MSIGGDNKHGPAATAVRPKRGELHIAENEWNQELGLLCGLTTKALMLGSQRDVIFSQCCPLASLRLVSARRVGMS